MLDFITINAVINAEEALKIRNYSGFKKPQFAEMEMYTVELADKGITQVSIWVNLKKLFLEPSSNYNCTINVTVDAKRFERKGKYDFSMVLLKIKEYLPEDWERKLDWKLQSASFVYVFQGYHIRDYYQFLKSGYDLKNMHLQREVHKQETTSDESYQISYTAIHQKEQHRDIIIEPREHSFPNKKISKKEKKELNKEKRRKERPVYDSLSMEILLDYNMPEADMAEYDPILGKEDIQYVPSKPKKDYLAFKLYLKKKKILPLCKEYGIKDRSLVQFQEMAAQIDVDMFCFYMGKIAGIGRYYKFSECERIIRNSEYTRAQKNKMRNALKGVALYKGIATFLDHVEDEIPRYPCMESMRKRPYAQEALRNLQKLGINPVNISVRKSVMSGSLPNLIEVYQEAVGKTSTPKRKTKRKKKPPENKWEQELSLVLGDGEEAPF